MSSQLSLDGTTVTLFGSSDALDQALSDELGRRGCNTHVVTVPMGWLRSATHAVLRLDTRAGAEALEQLVTTDHPPSHVIAVCPEQTEASARERLDEMCRGCGEHHDMSLIWHVPLDDPTPAASGGTSAEPPTAADTLASTIADEMAEHLETGPSFVTRPAAT